MLGDLFSSARHALATVESRSERRRRRRRRRRMDW
jgi:hypothetical protein